MDYSAATKQLRAELGPRVVRTDRDSTWSASIFDSSKIASRAAGGHFPEEASRRRRSPVGCEHPPRAGHGAGTRHKPHRVGFTHEGGLGDRPPRMGRHPHRRAGRNGARRGRRHDRAHPGRRREEGLVLSARPVVQEILHDRRQHRLQRRWNARRQIRRHPGLCPRAQGIPADRRVGRVGDTPQRSSPPVSICAICGSGARGCSGS